MSQREQVRMPLKPVEEHYLKRHLLKRQLEIELEALNEADALKRFGYPFKSEGTIDQKDRNDKFDTEFPLCSFVLQKIIMTFPLFARNLAVDEKFWQDKVQAFFEHFMSLGFSDSLDREKSTKRKKIGAKLSKVILLLFNSGIGTTQEVEYYKNDKFTFSNKKVRKRSKIEEFAMPSKDALKQLVTNQPIFINGWDINVVAVVKEDHIKNIKTWKKTQSAMTYNSTSSVFASTTHSVTKNTIKSLTSTSKWMTKTITSTPSYMFSKLSLTSPNTASTTISSSTTKDSLSLSSKSNKYWFIIKVIKEDEPTKIFYTAKTYSDFKILTHNLKNQSPDKKYPKLPHLTKKSVSVVTKTELLPNSRVPKENIGTVIASTEVDSITISSDLSDKKINNTEEVIAEAQHLVKEIIEQEEKHKESEESDNGLDNDNIESDIDSMLDEFEDATDTKTDRLSHEKMRTSIRQYLRNLTNDKETSENMILQNFLIKENVIDSTKFDDTTKIDIENRALLDVSNLQNQIKFQKLALMKSMALQDAMKEFKTSLLRDEKTLLSLMDELKTKTSVSELSPLLKTFVEWFKIYFASTIYQMFLGNDNSYSFYTQVRRLHKLIPYSMMSQIMKFTNPVAIMKSMIDLFMAQPFGSYSLLQTMFSTVLSDDLRSQISIIKKLENLIIESNKNASSVIKAIKKVLGYHHNHDNVAPIFDMNEMHNESQILKKPVIVIILMKCESNKMINNEAFIELMESYKSWLNHDLKEGLYFQHVKKLLQLYIKENDKKLMRKLWQDPELSRLLKAMVTMIYEPMIKIFKIARMDIALKNFEKFMNDLIQLMDSIINGTQGINTKFNVIEDILNLINKHQDTFFQFVHDVYVNDTEAIFEGFIKWFCNIIKFLQTSKFETDVTKRLDLNKLIEKTITEKDEKAELYEEINQLIDEKMESRRIYKAMIDATTKDDDDNKDEITDKNVPKFMTKRWNQVSSMVMPDSTISFGLQEGEMVDLDLDTNDLSRLAQDTKANGDTTTMSTSPQPTHPTTQMDRLQLSFQAELLSFLRQQIEIAMEKQNGLE